jgi:hypothetical protein
MIHGMTTEDFLKAKMAERTAKHLKIVILREDGTLFTSYPKDQATKQRWLDNYTRKGIVVVEA